MRHRNKLRFRDEWKHRCSHTLLLRFLPVTQSPACICENPNPGTSDSRHLALWRKFTARPLSCHLTCEQFKRAEMFSWPALLNPAAVVKVNVKITIAAFMEDMFLLSASPFVLLTISDPGYSGYLFNYSAKKDRRKRTDTTSIREGCLALPPFTRWRRLPRPRGWGLMFVDHKPHKIGRAPATAEDRRPLGVWKQSHDCVSLTHDHPHAETQRASFLTDLRMRSPE